MAVKSDSYATRKTNRLCCCHDPQRTEPKNPQYLLAHPEDRLLDLKRTYQAQVGSWHITDIRQFFIDSEIPFREMGCARSNMVCCGSCTRMCSKRCPQDVLNRAYLFCGAILDAPTEEIRQQRYQAATQPVRWLYDELTSETPRYFTIAEMIKEMTSPFYNKELERIICEQYGNEDSPHKLDYAPVIEYIEKTIRIRHGQAEKALRKKVDPETGIVSVLDWPRSGMCPFCLPTGLTDNRRTACPKDLRKHH